MDLSLATRAEGACIVVEVGGEIDGFAAPKLREKLNELVEAGNYQLVVDLEKVEFMDSAALGVLVGALRKMETHDGSLSLVCTRERLLKIFRITGLTKVFDIHPDVASAI